MASTQSCFLLQEAMEPPGPEEMDEAFEEVVVEEGVMEEKQLTPKEEIYAELPMNDAEEEADVVSPLENRTLVAAAPEARALRKRSQVLSCESCGSQLVCCAGERLGDQALGVAVREANSSKQVGGGSHPRDKLCTCRNVGSKLKEMLNDNKANQCREPRVRKPSKWDEVMNKIEAGKSEPRAPREVRLMKWDGFNLI